MKVITIKQPFATLIAEGLKEYEFRTWKTKFRGELLIHAGYGIDKIAIEKYKNYNLDYPKRCIIFICNTYITFIIIFSFICRFPK